MSFTRHIAEQPNILAADAEWRTTLSEVVNRLMEHIDGIKYMLNIQTGDRDDARMQFGAWQKLMETLKKLQVRQDDAVKSLEQHQEKWNAAVTSQDGRLGQLNTQLGKLKEELQESEGTARSMDEQRRQADSRLSSVKQQLSSAEAVLKTTETSAITITRNHKLEQTRLENIEFDLQQRQDGVVGREENLVTRESAARSRGADLGAQETELHRRLNDVRARENAVANSEATVQQDKARNDAAGHDLQSALSILHRLANATDSECNAPPTLDNIKVLAASIQTRIDTLRETLSEREHNLTDQRNHIRTVEDDLETLNTKHQKEMSNFRDLKAKCLEQGKMVEELLETQTKLKDKTEEYDGLFRNYANLESFHQTYLGELENSKAAHEKDKVHLSGLLSYRIPRLQASNDGLQTEVSKLTEQNQRLGAARTASDTEITKNTVNIRGLETRVQLLQAEIAQAQSSRRGERESLQFSRNALQEAKTVNGTLNTRLIDGEHQRQAAARDIGALRSEKIDLESLTSRLERSLAESATERQALEQAADEIKTNITGLESRCNEKDDINKSLKNESEAAASRARKTLSDMKDVLGYKNYQIQNLESEAEWRDSHIRSLETEIGTLKTNTASLQGQLEERSQESNSKQEQVESLLTSLSAANLQLSTNTAEYRKAAEGSAKEIEASKEQVRVLESRLTNVTKSQRDLQTSNHSLTEQANDEQERCNRLQTELRNIRDILLPEKQASIELLQSEAAEHDEQASTSRQNHQTQVSVLQGTVDAKATDIRTLQENYKSLEAAADESSKKARTMLTDAQATIESLETGLSEVIERKNRIKADLQQNRTELSNLKSVLRGKDRLEDELDNVIQQRDGLLEESNRDKAEIERLTALLRSGHSSNDRPYRKRPREVADSEEEETLAADHHERSIRRVGEATLSVAPVNTVGASPSGDGDPLEESVSPRLSRSREQATTTQPASGHQVGQPPVFQLGTRWRIEDVLDKNFTAPPIPQAILKRLRTNIRVWDKQRDDWRTGSKDRLPKCAKRFASRQGTQWVNGDCHRACSSCTDLKYLCVAVTKHHIEILPANGSSNSELGMEDSRYWLGS